MAEAPAGTVPRAFVCGHPVAHSRSPLIHRHWLSTTGIDGDYLAVDVAPPDLAAFLSGFRQAGYAGGNVTIPHKEEAFRLAGRHDEAADIIGAVNTLWLEDETLVAGNTDWIGFAANLDDFAPEWRSAKNAVVLGAGGAARGVIYALHHAGFRGIRILNRTVARAEELKDRFGGESTAHAWSALPDLLVDADLLINTTSIGMEGAPGELPDLEPLPDHALVTDIVYVPLETPLLSAARKRGLKTVDGLGMLLHQAAPGFERWFGVRPQVTPELRGLVLGDLAKHP